MWMTYLEILWWQAFVGYVWVLLDGGPSCAFYDADVKLMDEDLHILKTESVIQMLMTASELIPTGVESQKHGHMHVVDASALVRVLCHKKDKEASKFLKLHYYLPASSDYDDESPLKDSGLKPPMMADFIRTTSLQWSNNGHDTRPRTCHYIC
ncbi:protein unc-13 homolog [Apium graveolens]|uniref:protein unc-13 homolog n=1 Tax=Apium graveolens TaxID=4045 RepID=UPI003D7971A8